MSTLIDTSNSMGESVTSVEKGGWKPYRDIPALVVLTFGVALFLILAKSLLVFWHWEYTKPESYYEHALLIPVFVAVMIWHRRDALREAPKKTNFAALSLFVPALMLLIYAQKVQMEAIMSWSFLLAITSGVWFLFGTQFLKAASFPLFFLWLMAPLPGPVLNDATQGMQSASTLTATAMLKLIGLHPVQMGNVVQMDNYTMNVDVPCSGFKLLLRLLTFAAAFAYLTDTTLFKRWSLFVISIPLSLFINSLRIMLIGVVGECMGASAAHTFHDWSGIFTTVLCMALLFGIAKVLGCRSFAGQPIF